MKGIDVSHWQGRIDWGQVRAQGVEFAIIKATEGCGYRDPSFEEYRRGCTLPAGFYHFLRTADPAKAQREAADFLAALGGESAPMGCWLDCEEPGLEHMGKKALTAAALTFLKEVERRGYRAGVYCNRNWALHCLDLKELSPYRLWYARYTREDLSRAETGRQADMWQYTSQGQVPGVSSGRVDLNEAFFMCGAP